MIKTIIFLSVFSMVIFGTQGTHVFWYNALSNTYPVTETTPGPGLPQNAIIHEGMIATGTYANGLPWSDNAAMIIGNGATNDQGWSAFLWARNLNDAGMAGTVDSAFICAEIRDGFAGDAFCQAGPIAIRVGVVDVAFSVNNIWGGPQNILSNAVWSDLSMFASLEYGMNLVSGTESFLNITAPAGRSAESAPSLLDGQFLKLDVTAQVNYILQNQGQFAIVLLSEMEAQSTGKINLYADETSTYTGPGSDNPWTTDGNTAHLVVHGDISDPVGIEQTPADNDMVALDCYPNPFNPSVTVHAKINGGTTIHSVAVFNISGHVIIDLTSQLKDNKATWNAMSQPSGVYIIKAGIGQKTITQSIILAK